jgi:hydroxypyruvate reductase
VSLQDKMVVNAQLLASGADIEVMNLIRQQLSELKGGGMLRYAAPSPVTSLILSDVIGDDLRAVASGPTVAPIGTKAEARDILHQLDIWKGLPQTVRQVLQRPDVAQDLPDARNLLIGSNGLSLAAMAAVFPAAKQHALPLIGDVTQAVQRVANMGRGAHIFGGETTVKLTGTGRGGRNQDLALRLALRAEMEAWQGQWLYLQAGTDGRDGPTDAAGGVVCETTLSKVRAAGLDPAALLDNNDAYRVLAAAGGLHMTGATGTNVADLGILIRS